MLGHGEHLRTFEILVRELLERNAEKIHVLSSFSPSTGDIVSSCTSLFATVEQQVSYVDDTTVFCPIVPSTSCDTHALRLMTDAGHRLLVRFHRTQDYRDLDRSIKEFERTSDLCLIDRPCRPAALPNLAITKFVSFQVNGTYLDLNIPISLFQDALRLRPTSHPDRPVIQLHLAIALL
ncbi:uncharacterized protein EDB91DRAFT_549383 [Suillus paluster]|uniref:uncharacterized protein n=1 Tax=Suillus paluster TaxID=48578 RepID=UPI001B87400E|nr:uncharacterized protein EDB91DRAFT_549383 [Suillus paluster]KAG1735671.1 hypothetical protein EDB91DRAFT_549383 [Suillus paluster]